MASARLLAGGKEFSGELQELSPDGARLLCAGVPATEQAELVLEQEGWRLQLPVEILHSGEREARLAFLPADCESAEALNRLCRGEDPPSAPDVDFSTAAQLNDFIVLERVDSDWEPPASRPEIHEWAPEGGPLPEAVPEEPVTAWRRLPTLSVVPRLPPLPQATDASEPPAAAPPVTAPASPAAAPAPAAPAATLQSAPAVEPATDAAGQVSGSPEASPPPAAPAAAPVDAAAPAPRPARVDATGQAPERRFDERQERSIPVVFDNLTSLIKEFTHNISFGGLFTYTTQPRQVGEEVAVTLIHPAHGGRLTLLGRVAHAAAAPSADPASGQPRYGVGVQFRLPKEELQRLLSDFIGSHQQPRNPAGEVLNEAARLLAIEPDQHRQLLGVTDEAGEAEIRRAYFALVDRFHPDRFFGKVPADQQARLDELFRRLTAAYETLTR